MKNQKEGQKISGPFTAITERLWEADFDIYEVNIISRISSWERQGRKYFESEVSLAQKFGCDRRTVNARIKTLLKKGIITRGDKVGRAYEYKVNIDRLNTYIKTYVQSLHNICTPTVQIDEECVHPLHNTCTPTVHYQNNYQSIYKNTQMEEEDTFGGVFSPTEEDLKAFMSEIDI